MTPTVRRGGLAARLFTSHTIVVAVALATLWLVVSVAGPAIFHGHLRQAAGHVDPETSDHVEEAFVSATLVSVSVALAVAIIAAVLVAAFASRRVAAPVGRLAAAAHAVADGGVDVQVPHASLGAEFDELTDAFNAMAARLGAVEGTRRRMLGDLAHEMRTPVATLDGYLEGAQDGVVILDGDTLTMLRAQIARLTRLANDVSALSRVEEQQLEMHRRPTRARALVEAAVVAVQDRFAAAHVTLEVDLSDDDATVSADPQRFEQVLGNLLSNALRHTPAGGTVTIAARRHGEAVEFSVSDDGDGIAAEHLPHLFERFYRVDSARDVRSGGSGIGLAIVKALVTAHDGTVSAASDGPGRGATFTIVLPGV